MSESGQHVEHDVAAISPAVAPSISPQETGPQSVATGAQRTRSRSSESSSSSSSSVTLSIDERFDFGRLTRHLVRATSKENIKRRHLGIVFKDLRVVGVGSLAAVQETVGSIFNPLVILEKVQAARHPETRDLLSDFEGVVRPGEMLLVLGRPGAGCSTLLKCLTNQRNEYKAVHGDVHYDSLSPADLEKHHRGDVLYSPEDDVAFGSLTVGETLTFAAANRIPQHRPWGLSRSAAISKTVEVVTAVFGLRHALRTKVGNSQIRGISGGEKKRVSIAESLVCRPRAIAWDNSTRGLDASTALEFVRAIRTTTDTFEVATIASLYQAGEGLYELFDKVCVVYEGRMAYFGPANRARQYFIDLGYEPANRQTTADFCVAVTDPLSRIQRQDIVNVPRTAAEFASTFLASELGQLNKQDIQDYMRDHVGKNELAQEYKESAAEEHAKFTSQRSPYITSLFMQIRTVMKRRVQILRGNMLFTGLNAFAFLFQGIVIGTTFLQIDESTSAFFGRGGVLFFALLFASLASLSEIPLLYAQRPIVHRQMRHAMYHPWIEAAALTLVDIPLTFFNSVVLSLLIYFLVRLQPSAEQYFIFLASITLVSIVMKTWFRAIAAAFASQEAAQALAGLSVLILGIFSGYSIPRPSIVKGLRWITYINPLKYGFEIIMTNEFRSIDGLCSTLAPQGPGYDNIPLENRVCTTVGALPGEPTVPGWRYTELSYQFSYSNVGMNFGILVAFAAVFTAALLWFTQRSTESAVTTAVTLFKRGSAKRVTPPQSLDAEKGGSLDVGTPMDDRAPTVVDSANATPALRMDSIYTWQNLNYRVPIGDGLERQLLEDVSGYVAPGRLTALMGESGAGKTTLLNVLAQRTDTGVVTGQMLVNGQALPSDFQAQTGYCQQMDTHLAQTTVREALLFSAKLRQPANVPLSEKEAHVDQCLKMCGLESHAGAIVGTLGVEHRKRTTIGVELAAKPKLLLFLDEPTSGLDSQSAWAIMDFLRSLANQGQAILATIHQPSAELLQVFDRMLLLRKGGQTVYCADVGPRATTLIDYFERNGSRKCLEAENPAEFMLDVIGAGATATSTIDWYSVWNASPEKQQLHEDIKRIHADGQMHETITTTFHSRFATGWLYQVHELLVRLGVAYWRDPTYIVAKFALSMLGGLIIGISFISSNDSQQGTQNKLFSIFMATILSVPLSNQTQVWWIQMRNIYEIREAPSRMYGWTALLTAQMLVELPLNIATSAMIFFTWYWTVGFPTGRAGYSALLLMTAFPAYYQTFSQAVASMSPNVEIAALLFSFLFSFVITFNGVLQPYRELGWWQWMYRLSPFTYLIEGLLGQSIGHQRINCSPLEFVTINPPAGQTCSTYLDPYMSFAGGYLEESTRNATTGCKFCSTFTTDEFMGNAFNIQYEHHWRNLGFMFVFTAFNIVLVFGLTYLFRIRKGSLAQSIAGLFKRRQA